MINILIGFIVGYVLAEIMGIFRDKMLFGYFESKAKEISLDGGKND